MGKKKRKAAGRSKKPRPPGATIVRLAATGAALRKRVERDRRERYDRFRRKLSGKKPAARAATRGSVAPAAAGAQPPIILAEGDSWFEYPVPFSGGGVIDHLQEISGVDILNMAHHGDEVRQMLALGQRREIEKRLWEGDFRFDALLFSGGGNDLVGDQLCLWLKEFDPALPPAEALHHARVSSVLEVIAAGYRDLIAIRDALSPQTKIFVHGYDFPRATGKGVCGVGPWLKPSLDYRGVKDSAVQFEVVKALLMRFRAMIESIARENENVFYVQTQGLLDPAKDWHNEIHPNKKGFKKIATVFNNALAAHYPGAFRQA